MKNTSLLLHTQRLFLSHTIPPSMVFVIGERIFKTKFSLNIYNNRKAKASKQAALSLCNGSTLYENYPVP